MTHIIKRELKANFKALSIWSASMLLMALIGFGEYAIVMGEGTNMDLASVVEMMPRILQVMFGMGAIPVTTPAGWYVCMLLWCALIAYIHAALLGANMISKEERDKTSEFLFTRPIKRSTIISGKMIAATINSFVVVFVGWAGTMMVFAPHIKKDGAMGDVPITVGDVHVTMLGMFLTALLFLFVGFFISSIFTGRGKAAKYTSMIVIATYLIYVAIEMVDVDYLRVLSPFHYFNAASILKNGFDALSVLLTLAVIAIASYFTYSLYGKRNLHS